MLDVSLFASAKSSGRCAQNPKQSGVETSAPRFHALRCMAHSYGKNKEVAIASTRGVVGEGLQTCVKKHRKALLKALHGATDSGHDGVPEGQWNTHPCSNRPSASRLDGSAGAGIALVALLHWNRLAGREQRQSELMASLSLSTRGLGIVLSYCAIRSSVGVNYVGTS